MSGPVSREREAGTWAASGPGIGTSGAGGGAERDSFNASFSTLSTEPKKAAISSSSVAGEGLGILEEGVGRGFCLTFLEGGLGSDELDGSAIAALLAFILARNVVWSTYVLAIFYGYFGCTRRTVIYGIEFLGIFAKCPKSGKSSKQVSSNLVITTS
jgi:hypothetical protein